MEQGTASPLSQVRGFGGLVCTSEWERSPEVRLSPGSLRSGRGGAISPLILNGDQDGSLHDKRRSPLGWMLALVGLLMVSGFLLSSGATSAVGDQGASLSLPESFGTVGDRVRPFTSESMMSSSLSANGFYSKAVEAEIREIVSYLGVY